MKSKDPQKILETIISHAQHAGIKSVIKDKNIRNNVEMVCRTPHASIRLLMACLLGKLIDAKVDPRKPYTEIQSDDCFSGRTLDERFLSGFITANRLPCRGTTAFLTPVFRTMNRPLTKEIKLESRFRPVISAMLQLLDVVAKNQIKPDLIFIETVRVLIAIRDETIAVRESLLKKLKGAANENLLSAHDIFVILKQHLMCKHSSRLPVLIVAAAYEIAGHKIGEQVKKLNSHTAADRQTGALGDVEICLENDDDIVTVYEMKMKRVTVSDIDVAIEKIIHAADKVHHYIFISTEQIDENVVEYAREFYHQSNNTEIAILDCLGFLQHFLSFFHRYRHDFLNAYQNLVLSQSDADVNDSLKNTFLTLRANAENVSQC